MECREYARSLINNLSLLSGLVIVPKEADTQRICQHLLILQRQGYDLADTSLLIHGTPALDINPNYIALTELIVSLPRLQG